MINRPPDAEVILYLDPTEAGGKTRSVISGYRPVVAIKDHYLTSTHFQYLIHERWLQVGKFARTFGLSLQNFTQNVYGVVET